MIKRYNLTTIWKSDQQSFFKNSLQTLKCEGFLRSSWNEGGPVRSSLGFVDGLKWHFMEETNSPLDPGHRHLLLHNNKLERTIVEASSVPFLCSEPVLTPPPPPRLSAGLWLDSSRRSGNCYIQWSAIGTLTGVWRMGLLWNGCLGSSKPDWTRNNKDSSKENGSNKTGGSASSVIHGMNRKWRMTWQEKANEHLENSWVHEIPCLL